MINFLPTVHEGPVILLAGKQKSGFSFSWRMGDNGEGQGWREKLKKKQNPLHSYKTSTLKAQMSLDVCSWLQRDTE